MWVVSFYQYTFFHKMSVLQVTNIYVCRLSVYLSQLSVSFGPRFCPGGAVSKVVERCVLLPAQSWAQNRSISYHGKHNEICAYQHFVTVSELEYIKSSPYFFAGVHANLGPSGIHCSTSRAEYPAFCASLDSREATDEDVQASISTGHNCCMCGFTKEGTRLLVQGIPCSGRTTTGVHICVLWGGCGAVSSTFCRHNICEYQSISYIRFAPRFAPSQWETALLCNDVSHWLDANLESTLIHVYGNTNGFVTLRFPLSLLYHQFLSSTWNSTLAAITGTRILMLDL